MRKQVVASILHGAYGDVYEQAICLKHYARTHPETVLRLFAATSTRFEAFKALDLSFALSYDPWQGMADYADIDDFFQFQVMDAELRHDVIENLPTQFKQRLDPTENLLPWQYLRKHKLIPVPEEYSLTLNGHGEAMYLDVLEKHGLNTSVWRKPTVSFLWRYRGETRGAAISSFGQAPQEKLVEEYSALFNSLVQNVDCHLLVFGMNVTIDDSNRERLDNKYPSFGLSVPSDRVTYFRGLSWPVELEIASRADVCCGNASGFTEALWLKRGSRMVLMDAPYHYLAKIAFRRMPFFSLDQPAGLFSSIFCRRRKSYYQKIFSGL